MYKKLLLAVGAACVLMSNAQAQKVIPTNLYCRITSINNVAPNGTLDKFINHKGTAYGDGYEFIINRNTGAMLGQHVFNEDWMYENHIIDRGDEENSFKMFVSNRFGAKQGQYIDIRLWVDEPQKPFILVTEKVALGYCTYLPQRK